MPKSPATQWYVKDWMCDTPLQMCSATTKGVWINMLCEMWDAPVRGELKGTLTAISRTTKCTLRETKKLISENQINEFCFTEVDENGVWTIRNWRMHNAAKASGYHALRQKRYRERRKKSDAKSDAAVTPISPTPPPVSNSSIQSPQPPKVDYGSSDEDCGVGVGEEFKTTEAIEIAKKLYGRGGQTQEEGDSSIAIMGVAKLVREGKISLERAMACATDALLAWSETRGMPEKEFDSKTGKMKKTRKILSKPAYFTWLVKKVMKKEDE